MAFFFGSSPSPPPPKQFSIEAPSGNPYLIGLIFNIVSQVIAVPLCIAAFNLKKYPLVVVAIAVAVATIPLYVQPELAKYLVSNGWCTPLDALAARFVGSSTYAFCAFRIFGAAVGGTPKGADADVATWIAYATAACDPLFDKEGKPVRPPKGAVAQRVKMIALRILALSLASSLSVPFSTFPARAYATSQGLGPIGLGCAFVFDYTMIHLFQIYLFLSLLLDVGSLLLELQNYSPLTAFANPMFDTRSPRDFWGKKWNIQVTTTLKRCVFIPVRHKLGLPPFIAAMATFVSSGFFHEYQFILSFPNYAFGTGECSLPPGAARRAWPSPLRHPHLLTRSPVWQSPCFSECTPSCRCSMLRTKSSSARWV